MSRVTRLALIYFLKMAPNKSNKAPIWLQYLNIGLQGKILDFYRCH